MFCIYSQQLADNYLTFTIPAHFTDLTCVCVICKLLYFLFNHILNHTQKELFQLTQVHHTKLEYYKKFIYFSNSIQQVKHIYYIDSLLKIMGFKILWLFIPIIGLTADTTPNSDN